MRRLETLGRIDEELPDDVFLVSSSFEKERCRASLERVRSYAARCSVIINLTSSSGKVGTKRQEESTAFLIDRLRDIDVRSVPRLLSIGPYDYFGLWGSLTEELDRRGLAWGNLRVTVDVSCLTKVQLIFLLKEMIVTRAAARCRVLYTVPSHYNRERGNKFSWLAAGYFRPVVFPVRAEPRIVASWRRVALVILGHEGQRTLAAWRYIDPDETMLIFAKSDNQQMVEICRKENELIVSSVGGEDSDRVMSCDFLDVLNIRDKVAAWLEGVFERQDTTLSLVPFGPKPVVIGVLLAILEMQWADVELVYPVPSAYNASYSSGAKEVYTLDLL